MWIPNSLKKYIDEKVEDIVVQRSAAYFQTLEKYIANQTIIISNQAKLTEKLIDIVKNK